MLELWHREFNVVNTHYLTGSCLVGLGPFQAVTLHDYYVPNAHSNGEI